jgi:hypothetical protein
MFDARIGPIHAQEEKCYECSPFGHKGQRRLGVSLAALTGHSGVETGSQQRGFTGELRGSPSERDLGPNKSCTSCSDLRPAAARSSGLSGGSGSGIGRPKRSSTSCRAGDIRLSRVTVISASRQSSLSIPLSSVLQCNTKGHSDLILDAHEVTFAGHFDKPSAFDECCGSVHMLDRRVPCR